MDNTNINWLFLKPPDTIKIIYEIDKSKNKYSK